MRFFNTFILRTIFAVILQRLLKNFFLLKRSLLLMYCFFNFLLQVILWNKSNRTKELICWMNFIRDPWIILSYLFTSYFFFNCHKLLLTSSGYGECQPYLCSFSLVFGKIHLLWVWSSEEHVAPVFWLVYLFFCYCCRWT